MRLFRSALNPASASVSTTAPGTVSKSTPAPLLATVVLAALFVAQAGRAGAQVDSTVKTDSSAKTIVNQEQAVRGMTVFTKTCVECHTKTDVTGADFKIKWNGRPVYDLFDVIRTTMPDDKPGSMTQDQYVDVVSYLLRINGASAGGAALVATDTAGLKKAKMEIVVPSPNIDSVKVDGISLGGVRSTPPQPKPAGSLFHSALVNSSAAQHAIAGGSVPSNSTGRSAVTRPSAIRSSTQPLIGINHLLLRPRSLPLSSQR